MGESAFSIIVPTRGRPDRLSRLFRSFEATTVRPEQVELVLVIDEDDRSYDGLSLDGVRHERVVVPAGLNMGELNMAGYERASGRYVMLLNDDVVIRTKGWDEQILAAFQSFPDGVVLAHVNDGIFGDKLCTFPFVPRRFCELAGGICPRGYRRYRIDDHIYNVFNLLSVLGQNRLLYLPDVLFEHQNYIRDAVGAIEYRPDEAIHAVDTRLFDDLLEERKHLAVRLAAVIDEHRRAGADGIRRNLLAPITDSVSLRRPEFVRVWRPELRPTSETARVTVGIVSADLRSAHAQACIRAVKAFTRNIDLVILDNGRALDFNHPREMNRLLAICRTDYLVLMDDDVIVEAGWLDGLLRCLTSRVGVVTPLFKDSAGRLSYAGVVLRPDYSGHHSTACAVADGPFRIQTLCTAAILIDMTKCAHLRVDEAYPKYFLDIDYGLRVWESGFEVVCSPHTIVTHIGGATLTQGGELSLRLFEEQRQRFVRSWIHTGRYRVLERGALWQEAPEIRAILEVPDRLTSLLASPSEPREAFVERAHRFFEHLANYRALQQWVTERLWAAVGSDRPAIDDPQRWHLAYLLGQTEYSVLVERGFSGLSIVLWNGQYYAVPPEEGAFDPVRFEQAEYSRGYKADRLDLLKVLIRADIRAEARPHPVEPRPAEPAVEHPRSIELVEEGYKGFNLVRYDRIYGLAQADGPFDIDRVHAGGYPILLAGYTVEEVKAQIDRLSFELVEEGYRGFNLVRYDRIYALLQGDGAFDVERVRRGDYAVLYRGTTVADVKRQIDIQPPLVRLRIFVKRHRRLVRVVRWLMRALGQPVPGPSQRGAPAPQTQAERKRAGSSRRWVETSPITRVAQDCRGYAIYRYEFKYFAIPATAGEFDYERYRSNAYGTCPIGHSIGEVKSLIDLRHAPGADGATARTLLFCPLPKERMRPYLTALGITPGLELLCPAGTRGQWEGFTVVEVDRDDLFQWARDVAGGASRDLVTRLAENGYGKVVIPWCVPEAWRDNSLEVTASRIAQHVEVVDPSGQRRSFHGENLHRLVYNKAYLASMFEVVHEPGGRLVLEVGCSDGLVCDTMALLGAQKVVGIDVMKTVGCSFPGAGIEYRVMDAANLEFPNESFDIVCSIATLEHVADPVKVLDEIVRVLKVGGYGYVQAGPLYHSPFGHHMFAYFQDCPWIHLRKSTDEVMEYVKTCGIDAAIERDLGLSAEEYLHSMLNPDHLNGSFLADYGLDEFRARADLQVLKNNVSYQGRELLSADVVREVRGIDSERLVEHGFEIAFRKVR